MNNVSQIGGVSGGDGEPRAAAGVRVARCSSSPHRRDAAPPETRQRSSTGRPVGHEGCLPQLTVAGGYSDKSVWCSVVERGWVNGRRCRSGCWLPPMSCLLLSTWTAVSSGRVPPAFGPVQVARDPSIRRLSSRRDVGGRVSASARRFGLPCSVRGIAGTTTTANCRAGKCRASVSCAS